MQTFIAQLAQLGQQHRQHPGVRASAPHTTTSREAREMIKQGVSRPRAARARSLCGRWRDPAGGAAAGVRDARARSQSRGAHHPTCDARLSTAVCAPPRPIRRQAGRDARGRCAEVGRVGTRKAPARRSVISTRRTHDGATTVAYLWARTIPCPNRSCGSAVPLIRQTWLARKAQQVCCIQDRDGRARERSALSRRHGGRRQTASTSIPRIGTSEGGNGDCPCCGTPLSEKYIKAQAVAGQLGAVPVAVVTDTPGAQGKRYRDVTESDRCSVRGGRTTARSIAGSVRSLQRRTTAGARRKTRRQRRIQDVPCAALWLDDIW